MTPAPLLPLDPAALVDEFRSAIEAHSEHHNTGTYQTLKYAEEKMLRALRAPQGSNPGSPAAGLDMKWLEATCNEFLEKGIEEGATSWADGLRCVIREARAALSTPVVKDSLTIAASVQGAPGAGPTAEALIKEHRLAAMDCVNPNDLRSTMAKVEILKKAEKALLAALAPSSPGTGAPICPTCRKRLVVVDHVCVPGTGAEVPKISYPNVGTNRYGVDVDYFRKELQILAERVIDGSGEWLARYLRVLADAAAPVPASPAAPAQAPGPKNPSLEALEKEVVSAACLAYNTRNNGDCAPERALWAAVLAYMAAPSPAAVPAAPAAQPGSASTGPADFESWWKNDGDQIAQEEYALENPPGQAFKAVAHRAWMASISTGPIDMIDRLYVIRNVLHKLSWYSAPELQNLMKSGIDAVKSAVESLGYVYEKSGRASVPERKAQ